MQGALGDDREGAGMNAYRHTLTTASPMAELNALPEPEGFMRMVDALVRLDAGLDRLAADHAAYRARLAQVAERLNG